MEDPEERASPGDRRARLLRLLPLGLAVVVLVNGALFVRAQGGADRLRLRRTTDVEEIAAHSPSRVVRERHAIYYRLARELHGATLHMDGETAARHRWALEGLGDMTVVVSRRSRIQIAAAGARPLIDGATYLARFDGRKLHVLLDPREREYVLSWVGKGQGARLLLAPLSRFVAASGKL